MKSIKTNNVVGSGKNKFIGVDLVFCLKNRAMGFISRINKNTASAIQAGNLPEIKQT